MLLYPETRSIQVIDGNSERIIDNITIGSFPYAVEVSSVTNRIYVTSSESNILYIIDGLTNNITHKINAGESLGVLDIDSNEYYGERELIFVLSTANNSISVIDSTTGEVKSNIKTLSSPYRIAIDSIKNRIYVTETGQNYTDVVGVEVIDYYTEYAEKKFNFTVLPLHIVGYMPSGITVDPSSSRAFVGGLAVDKVSVIDTDSNQIVGNISLDFFPNTIAFDKEEKKLYVTTAQNNVVYIIDTTSKDLYKPKDKSEIPQKKVDSIPYDIAINTNTNIIYLANYDSETVSLIDSDTTERITSVSLTVTPPNAGRIKCNNTTQDLNTPKKMIVGTKCNLIAEHGFAYDPLYNYSEGNSNYTISYVTLFHIHNITKNTIEHLFNNTFGQIYNNTFGQIFHSTIKPPTLKEFTIDHYGSYTFNLLSLPAIVNSASIFLSFGTLLIVIILAIIKSVYDNRRSDEKPKSNLYYINPEDDEQQIDKQKENVFSKAEIIGFDVAVIAGILIFLTISEGFESGEQLQISMITATIVFPFAISAVFAITDKIGFSTRLMAAGFVNLMIAVLLLAIMKIYQ